MFFSDESAMIADCMDCGGTGLTGNDCPHCERGERSCGVCDGQGWNMLGDLCRYCEGYGVITCPDCDAGDEICSVCDGLGVVPAILAMELGWGHTVGEPRRTRWGRNMWGAVVFISEEASDG